MMKVIFQKKEVFLLPKNSQSDKTSALSSSLKDPKSGGTLQIIKNVIPIHSIEKMEIF